MSYIAVQLKEHLESRLTQLGLTESTATTAALTSRVDELTAEVTALKQSQQALQAQIEELQAFVNAIVHEARGGISGD